MPDVHPAEVPLSKTLPSQRVQFTGWPSRLIHLQIKSKQKGKFHTGINRHLNVYT